MAKLLRPDINTKFHIDYDWWSKQQRDVRIIIWEHLCPECKEKFGTHTETGDIDWVDPNTGEVTVVDGLMYSLRDCCSRKQDYVTHRTPLATSIFRLFLANGNSPLSATEIYEKIDRRDPEAILRILLGRQSRTHYGMGPIL